MKSVLFLHQGAEMYGSDYIFYQVVREAAEICRPIVVLDSGGPLVDRLQGVAEAIHIVPLGVLRRQHFNPRGLLTLSRCLARAVGMIRRLARENQAELIYTNTLGVLAGLIAAKASGLPSIVHVHEILVKPRVVGVVLATLAKALATRVVAVSGPVKEYLDRDSLLRRDRVEVIHNGISTERFDSGEHGRIREEFGIPGATLLIAMVGRLHFWKGQDFLLDAAAMIRSRGLTDFRILFFGDVYPGYEDLHTELRAKSRMLGLQDNVVFAGFRDDAHLLFLDADVVVLPSTLPDPLPTVVLEAMAARRPVVATAHGGALEMVVDGETGFLVSPVDPAEMAERLIVLAADPHLREDMGRRGRARLQRLFSEQRFADEIRVLITEIGGLAAE